MNAQSRRRTSCSIICYQFFKEFKALHRVSRAILNWAWLWGLWRQITLLSQTTGFLFIFHPSHRIHSNRSMLNFCYTISKYLLGLAPVPPEYNSTPESFLMRQRTWSQQQSHSNPLAGHRIKQISFQISTSLGARFSTTCFSVQQGAQTVQIMWQGREKLGQLLMCSTVSPQYTPVIVGFP